MTQTRHLAFLLILYIFLGYLSLTLAGAHELLASVWYANSVCGFLMGVRLKEKWPEYLMIVCLGSLITDFGLSFYTVEQSLAFLLGDLTETFSIAILSSLYTNYIKSDRVQCYLKLLALSLLIPSFLGASTGALSLHLLAEGKGFLNLFITWFVGSTLGGLTVLPLLFLVVRKQQACFLSRRYIWHVSLIAIVSFAIQFEALNYFQYPFIYILAFLALVSIVFTHEVIAALLCLNGIFMIFMLSKYSFGELLPPDVVSSLIVPFILTLLPPLLISVGKRQIGSEISKFKKLSSDLEEIYSHTPVAMLSYNDCGEVLTVSDTWLELTGYKCNQVIGKNINLFVSDINKCKRASKGEPDRVEIRGIDNSSIIAEVGLRSCKFSEFGSCFDVAVFQDVTNEIELSKSLEREKELLECTLSTITDGVILIDEKDEVSLINSSAMRIFKLQEREALGEKINHIISLNNYYTGDSVNFIKPNVSWISPLCISSCNVVEQIFKVKTIETLSSTLAGGRIVIFRDITESFLKREDELYQATHDSITGLPNERKLNEDLTSFCNGHDSKALIALGVNNFDHIIYKRGKVAGEQVVKALSKELIFNLDNNDRVYHVGSNEFAILLVGKIIDKVDKVKGLINQSIECCGNSYKLSGCVGVYAFESMNLVQISEALNRAKLAYNEASQKHVACTYYYSGLETKFNRFIYISNQVSKALESGSVYLEYQPVVCAITGKLLSLEALCRCISTSHEQLSPLEFIAVAEQSGKIIELGKYIIESAVDQIDKWKKEGVDGFTVAINVSPVQLTDDSFFDFLQSILAFYNVPPHRIILEVTESSMIEDWEVTLKLLNKLKKIGIQLALDDFGTGFSSLSYLKKLPIEYLKIDKSFIDGIASPEGETLTQLIISIGQALGLQIITEGVETKRQVEILKRWGANRFQGYYYSKPVKAKIVKELLLAKALAYRQ
ncbi:EAL domain-containing protein [Pseudoalteromonas sp. L23]|uniref:GGDEF domain-containing phosphodiesterase n=1 Tax=unclassified Pseudoalteromonas TaxID=194690 RepID=UPI001EEFE950|nr:MULTISPECIES: GGDEF domain-containing phosphodiesterase [unclassified Pseudoalteromonas]MCF7516486.1 EAL domain-containing protein [Pseudoalteromonas sp. L7]MCF7528541.1 EAL domain-containing protein [Pseudoalteromonas sp. L23]